MEADAKKKTRKIVPWFSMLEWSEVYKQIYSIDINLQKKGYERLLVWKARSTALPAGVECTLSLIHVSIQDKEMWPLIINGRLPLYREHDLRLMYSTSIMRFLNHISAVAQTEKDTLYRMAQKLNIPDWVVNIRHSAAHSNSLPSLNVLRSASHFTLTWIHEHYWKEEAVSAVDYFAAAEEVYNTDELTKQIQEYIEMWQVLKLYSLNGYEDVTDIPDPQLMPRLFEIIDRLPKKRKNKVKQTCTLNSDSENVQTDETILEKRQFNTNITLLLCQLLKHLEVFLSKHKAIVYKEDLLISTVLECETFFPGEDLIQVLGGESVDEKSVPRKLMQLSEDLLRLFQKIDMLQKLVKKFVRISNKTEENDYRRKVCAIWIKEICRGLIKAKKVKSFKKNFDKDNKPSDVKNYVVRQVEKIHPHFKGALSLKPIELIITEDLLKEILLSPNKWTSIYLPGLLEWVDPALPSTVKVNILNLVQTYMCEIVQPDKTTGCRKEHKIQIYTLDMLENNLNDSDAREESEMEVDVTVTDDTVECLGTSEDLSSSWIQSESYLEWEDCPLGILPWQKTHSEMNHNLTCDTIWKSTISEPLNMNLMSEFPVHLPETINWDNVKKRKRIKKKQTIFRNKQRLDLIKNACATILG